MDNIKAIHAGHRPAGARGFARHGAGRHRHQERALTGSPPRCRIRQRQLLAANARDVAAARANGLDAASVDRLTLTEKTVHGMAEGLLQIAAAARPDRRDQRPELPPFRHPGRQDARAAGRDRHHLRVAPQRHRGRRRAVPEIRQRGDPARRLGSASIPIRPSPPACTPGCAPPACRRLRCR